LVLACTILTSNFAQAQHDSVSLYRPSVDGTIRAKYEYQPQTSSGRFEVRNARFSLSGNVSADVSYRAEIDLSDEGSIHMLDAFARYRTTPSLYFTIGQMRVPFTIDAHRSPHQQYFANRSFIAKQVGNVRDVGATLLYVSHSSFPFIIEAGLFNGSGLTNQKDYWAKHLNYSAKLQLPILKNMNLVLSSQSIRPDSISIHLHDVGINWHPGRLMVEGEFLYKTYEHSAYKDVKAFDSFVNYDIPLRKIFRKVSLLARYDSMTDHSNGIRTKGLLTTTDVERKRLTGGLTFSLAAPFIADIRLNYEKYFYRHSDTPKVSERDKMVIEMMVRF
jgi:hypothetical protein